MKNKYFQSVILAIIILLSGCNSKPNISLKELTKPDFVKCLNSIKDTAYNNARTGDVKFYEWGGCLGYPFNNTTLHKYFITHLPKGYAGDTSVNTRTTLLEIEIVHFIDGDDWELHYTLWGKNNDIIISSSDDNQLCHTELWKLPDMSKYGYK